MKEAPRTPSLSPIMRILTLPVGIGVVHLKFNLDIPQM